MERISGWRLAGILLCALAMLGVIRVTNANLAGGRDRLGAYFAEYEHGGSGKWRGADGRAFHSQLLVWGVGSVGAALSALLIALFRSVIWRRDRLSMALVAVAAASVVAWHLKVGTLSAAFGGW